MSNSETPEVSTFHQFIAPLIGLTVSHIWRGYGSALFLELGELTPHHRRNGSLGNPIGEMSVTIEWSWRIEEELRIIGGSWSDEKDWQFLFDRIRETSISEVSLFARLPELQLKFSNGLYLCSMMTSEGDPDWAILDYRQGKSKSVCVKSGSIIFSDESRRNA